MKKILEICSRIHHKCNIHLYSRCAPANADLSDTPYPPAADKPYDRFLFILILPHDNVKQLIT
ncbi:hypothetical protein [Enterocloster asparagiformis]|uniref:hypothetical protein n=1 Tax=Enterocloster asparagiformis TaxID=333367 RepID=UPI0021A3AB78|nr:hypothetical protein [Enterocloster asparagiformis]UWO78790.1 hypothetical protein NQ535_11110 [[Clostridium] asparagiforme DSM 15981]